MKMVWWCLAAVCVLCATFAATGASAALPELGKCEKVQKVKEGTKEHYDGVFTNAGCTTLSKRKRGRYEWAPESGTLVPKETYAEPMNFETAGTFKEPGTDYECGQAKFESPEITGPKTEKFSKIELDNCGPENQACWTAPDKGATIFDEMSVEAELGMITVGKNKKKTTAGWVLEGLSMVFECGPESPEVESFHTLEGSAIGVVRKVNVMEGQTEINFQAKEGKQIPEAFEGSETTHTLTMTSLAGAAKTTEQAGLTGQVINRYTYPEEWEVKAKE